jgi:5-methylcytosine-specific restriction endonuclease McrA
MNLLEVVRVAYLWSDIIGEDCPVLIQSQQSEGAPGFVDYQAYIHSPEWKAKSLDAKERAGYRCQVCNSPDRLETHHRTYVNLGHEKPEDLTVLCHKHHDMVSAK